MIAADRKAGLYAYFGGIARGEGFSLISAGGTADHVHLLFVLPARYPLAQAVQKLKGSSSRGWALIFAGRKDTEPSA